MRYDRLRKRLGLDQMEGLGDVVHAVTKKVGIKECAGCAKRRKKLNDKVPFRRSRT